MKIDFVVTWVDGSDPNWIAEKSAYSPSNESIEEQIHRYRSWDNLHYWFRGIEKFAPWVNKVHFITVGHLPAWLNTAHPKINIVKHEDYIPHQYLPTFSSHPIELNLHRIPELAEQFVYFNDDMFIVDDVSTDFFFQKGLPCDQASLDYITSDANDSFPHILLNSIDVINRFYSKKAAMHSHFKKWYTLKYSFQDLLRTILLSWTKNFSGIGWQHLPQAYLKQTFFDVWEKDFSSFDETSKRKFRDYKDVSPYVMRYWQLVEGEFYPVNMQSRGKAYHLPAEANALFEHIRKQLSPLVCANDTERCDNFEEVKKELQNSFQAILPEKSSFEY